MCSSGGYTGCYAHWNAIALLVNWDTQVADNEYVKKKKITEKNPSLALKIRMALG